MRIAYLISAHTEPEQLARLVAALGPRAEYFVHIDRKSDIEPFRRAAPSAHFLSERVDVRWGTINEWYYQLLLLREAISFPARFDRLVTLSGLDYPLWSNQRIEEYFSQTKQELLAAMPMMEDLPSAEVFRQFRPYLTLPGIGNRGNQRVGIALRRLAGAVGYRRRFTFAVGGDEWRQWKGAAWWAISQELAEYVVSTYDRHRSELLRQFRHQHCPAETMVQTIAMNSPQWRARCVEFPCHSRATLAEKTLLHHIDYDGAVRVWTSAADHATLVASGKMFARKFTSASAEVLDLIDAAR